MIEIEFRISLPEALEPKTYSLFVDGKRVNQEFQLGELRKVLYEIEKNLRLRFKENLNHSSQNKDETHSK